MDVPTQQTAPDVLKYHKDISEMSLADCPRKNSQEKENDAYRFCFDDPDDPENWITQAEKLKKDNKFPRRNSSPSKICDDFALSFYNTEENARNAWTNFAPKVKEILKYTQIGVGRILKTDGLCTVTDHQGHFNLHEYSNTNFISRFSIKSSL